MRKQQTFGFKNGERIFDIEETTEKKAFIKFITKFYSKLNLDLPIEALGKLTVKVI